MIRKLAQFVFWVHVRGTLWTSGILVLVAALNQLNLVFPVLEAVFDMEANTYGIIDSILGPVGLASLAVYILAFLVNRRRRAEDRRGQDAQVP